MSTCPSKDIHSIYLDNELPEKFKAEYEAHIKTCEKCQNQLNRLKSLRELLKEDSSDAASNSKFLDESFERLTLKMNYSKNTGKSEKKYSSSLKYVIPAAAAAAVVALVVPLRLNSVKSAAIQPQVSSIASAYTTSSYNQVPVASNVSFGGGNSRVISGNIQESVLPSTVSNSAAGNKRDLIDGVEVFRPPFDEGKTISIKIIVPGMNAVPVSTEIELPVNIVTGQY